MFDFKYYTPTKIIFGRGTKVLVALLIAIVFAMLAYIFALPKYAEYRIKNAKFVDVWCGDIMFGMDEDEEISAIMQSIDIPAWQRRMTNPERKDKQGLPSMYITVDNKYDMNFWVFEETCYVHVFYHSSGIEIGIYEMDIEKYYECVANLAMYYNNLPGLEEADQVGLIAQRDDIWAICSVYDEAYETSTSVDMLTDTFAITRRLHSGRRRYCD